MERKFPCVIHSGLPLCWPCMVLSFQVGGNCTCKAYVTGRRCDRCLAGYFNLQSSNPAGCEPCGCNTAGTVAGAITCDQTQGACICKQNVRGRTCNQCEYGFYNLDVYNLLGCTACQCSPVGSTSLYCNPVGGQCPCKTTTEGKYCNSCKAGYYNFTKGCIPCDCSPDGIGKSSTLILTSMLPDDLTCLPPEPGSYCNKVTGQCTCKKNVMGLRCEQCKDGFYDLDGGLIIGCKSCSCNAAGTVPGSEICDKTTGECDCKENVQGRSCNQCKPHTYLLRADNEEGCQDCNCDPSGTVATDQLAPNGLSCDENTGQCTCLAHRQGIKCDTCEDGKKILSSPCFLPSQIRYTWFFECPVLQASSSILHLVVVARSVNAMPQAPLTRLSAMLSLANANVLEVILVSVDSHVTHVLLITGAKIRTLADARGVSVTNQGAWTQRATQWQVSASAKSSPKDVSVGSVRTEPVISALIIHMAAAKVSGTTSTEEPNLRTYFYNVARSQILPSSHLLSTFIWIPRLCSSDGVPRITLMEWSNNTSSTEMGLSLPISAKMVSSNLTLDLWPIIILVILWEPMLFSTPERSYNDTSLAPFTTYTYQVQVFNDYGSAKSIVVSVRTLSGAPSGTMNIQVTGITANAANFFWNRPAAANGNIQSYRLISTNVLNTTEVTVYRGLETYVTLTNLMPYMNYTFMVEACTDGGCLNSEKVVVITREAVPAGQGPPNITALSNQSLFIIWEPPEEPNGKGQRYSLRRI